MKRSSHRSRIRAEVVTDNLKFPTLLWCQTSANTVPASRSKGGLKSPGPPVTLLIKLSKLAENLSSLQSPVCPISQNSFIDFTQSSEHSDWIMAASTTPEGSQQLFLLYQGWAGEEEVRPELKLLKLTPGTCRFKPGSESNTIYLETSRLYLPDSACSSQSMNFFICSMKTVQPLGMWPSLYHLSMTSSLRTCGGEIMMKPDRFTYQP